MKAAFVILSLGALIMMSCVPNEGATRTGITAALTQTIAPTATPTKTSVPTATGTPSPMPVGGGSGRIGFSLARSKFLTSFPDLKGEVNVFTANLDGTDLTPVTNGLDGYNFLESVSPDGTKGLAVSAKSIWLYESNQKLALYLIDLTEPSRESVRITQIPASVEFAGYGGQVYGFRSSIARWIDKARIVYIGEGKEGFGIYTGNIDGANWKNIFSNDSGVTPLDILALDGTRVYWGSKFRTSYGNKGLAVWWSNIDGSGQGKLESNGVQIKAQTIRFSADGSVIAWVEDPNAPLYKTYLHLATVTDINNPSTVELGDTMVRLIVLPDGLKGFGFYLASPGFFEVSMTPTPHVTILDVGANLSDPGGLNTEIFDVSPDGRQVLVAMSIFNAKALDLERMRFSPFSDSLASPDLRYSGIYWIP